MKSNDELTLIRRNDRRVDDQQWIVSFLKRAPFGMLAMAVDNQPFVNTNNFVYDEERHVIYLHHADEGRLVECLKANPKVCFTAAEMGRLLPAPRSRGFSVEFASVVAFGEAHAVQDTDEMVYALRLIMAKYAPHLAPGVDYAVLTDAELHGVAVYRLDISGWSAKRKQAAEDFPGAYLLKDVQPT